MKKSLKKPKYILFDVGNVLVYKVTHEDENIAKLLGMTRTDYRKFLDDIIANQSEEESNEFKNIDTLEKEILYLNKLHKGMCNKLGIEANDEFISKMTKCRTEGDFALKPGVIESLTKLSERYRLGIFSNALPSRRYHELRIGGLYKFFEDIFISHEIGFSKPNPEAYRYVLRKINCDGKDVMFIDDWSAYLEGARIAGISNLVMVKNKEESKKYPMINDLRELVDLLF
jgi:HAD superfamily hydrolase (TIGR01509 family)